MIAYQQLNLQSTSRDSSHITIIHAYRVGKKKCVSFQQQFLEDGKRYVDETFTT